MQQKNVWYACALGAQVDRTLLRRVVVGEAVVLFRGQGSDVIALHDRCPHRFAPLSRGNLLDEDVVQCGYHGLRFDRTGACVFNPHGDLIAPNCFVRSFPVVERHGLVWCWVGDPQLALPDTIPDLSYMTQDGFRSVHRYTKCDFRHDILVDNLLDLSHSDYVHVGSFAGGVCDRSETRAIEQGRDVLIEFLQFNSPTPPGYEWMGEFVDQRSRITWHPGNVITYVYSAAVPGGNVDDGPVVRFAHIVTPESDDTTHYFMSITRDFALDDPEMDVMMGDRLKSIVDAEDVSMLEAVAGEMGDQDLLKMRPVILPTDVGALRVRRVVNRMIEAERAKSSDQVVGDAAAASIVERV